MARWIAVVPVFLVCNSAIAGEPTNLSQGVRLRKMLRKGTWVANDKHRKLLGPTPVFSPDAKLLATLHRGQVELWDVEKGSLLGELVKDDFTDVPPVFSPDGSLLATGERDGSVKLWKPWTRRLAKTLSLPKRRYAAVNCIAFTPDGSLLARGSSDGLIEIWDVPKAVRVRRLSEHAKHVEVLAFTSDGSHLVSAQDSGLVEWWEVSSGKSLAALGKRPEWIGIVVFSPDTTVMLSGRDSGMKLWDSRSGKLLRDFESPVYYPGFFSKNGNTVVSSFQSTRGQTTVRFWEVRTGKVSREYILPLVGVCRLALSPDGRALASGDETGSLALWTLRD